jgi:UDP-N-acetylmuramoylalanine--D-glutamate ligase
LNLTGVKTAILGIGVSGQGVARAAQRLGGTPTVFDEKPNDSPGLIEAVDRLTAEGIDTVTSWHGRLDPEAFDIVVVSPGFPRGHPAVRDALRGGKPVWSEVEFAFRIAKAPILAVTGTNGKSTTTALLWSLLRGQGANALLCGNISGSGYPETTLTQAAVSAGSDDVLVAEVSSFQLEWVDEFRPRIAAVTNVTPDHMDRYDSFEDYVATKLRIFARMGPDDVAVVNVDEARPRVSEVPSGPKVVTVSPSGTRRSEGTTRRDGLTVRLGPFEALVSELPWSGGHDLANALVAWEMASAFAEPNLGMWEALRSFKGLSHRMEIVGSRNGVTVVNNSMCTNPAALIASSRSIPGRQHVLMGGETKGLDYSSVGRHLLGSGHAVYVFGQGNQALLDTLGLDPPVFATLEAAFAAAVAAAEPGDCVVLAPGCASSYPYANFRERGDAFRSIATVWISGGSL